MRFYKLSLGFGLLAMLFPLAGSAQEQTIHCVSEDGGKRYCPADTSHGVHLVKRRSSEIPCPQDRAWGYDEKGIWVDHGCDATSRWGRKRRREAGASH